MNKFIIWKSLILETEQGVLETGVPFNEIIICEYQDFILIRKDR